MPEDATRKQLQTSLQQAHQRLQDAVRSNDFILISRCRQTVRILVERWQNRFPIDERMNVELDD
jgi:hypothetical protein